MDGERRYRGGSRDRSPSPRRAPLRSRDWKLSPYRRRVVEEYPEEVKPSRRIEKRDYFDDRVSRFSDYDGRERDRYKDGGTRFRSPREIEEKVNYDRPGNFADYGAEGKYGNEVSVGGSRRLYDGDSYRHDSSSMKLKWDHPMDRIQKSDRLSLKDYGITRSSSGFGDIRVTSSGDRDYNLQNRYLDPNQHGLPVSRYLDSTAPVPIEYENRGKIHSDSYTLARGEVSDLPVINARGGDGSSHMSYNTSEYLNSDASRKRYIDYGDEPHLERRDGLNDREDNYFEKKSSGFHFQDRNLGVGKTVESELYKSKKEDNLLSSRSYLKGDSDYMVSSSSQHKDYNHVHSGIPREGFSGYSPTRDLHLPSSDAIHRGSRLSQPTRYDGYSEKKQNMLLTETGGQLDDKRSSSHLYDGLPEDRQGDWSYDSYAEFGRSRTDSLSTRANDVEEDYRDPYTSRSNAIKRTVDACSRKEHMEDDGLWNQYPPYQVQSTPDKFYVHGSSIHMRREDVDTLGSGSTRLDYGADGYYGYGGVKTEQQYADMDGRQRSQFEDLDHSQSRENDSTFGRIYDSPRKRLPMVDSSLVEAYDRRPRDRLVRDEMYEDEIGIRISTDGNGARRIYSQADVEDEIDLLHLPKKPKSSRDDYVKTWRGLGSDETSSSKFHTHRSFKPQKSNSRDIKKRLGPTQKLHVSQRLVNKYKPSIKKRLAPPPSKKHNTLPWLKSASSSKMTNEKNDPDEGIKDHGGDHSGDHLPRSKPEPPEKSEEFKQLVQNAFFKFLKQINETPMKRKKFMEQGKAGILKCFVCGSNSEEFVGTENLAMHAFTSKTGGVKSQHLGLHKALCALMGWKTTDEHPSSEWHCEAMTDAQARALKEDLIIWPPLVVVHNSTIDDSTSPSERVIISAEKLDTKLRDMGFKSILKVCYGKPANQSVMLVKFNGTLSGLREAERFHKSYIKSKHGRVEFKQLKSESGSSRGEKVASSEREDEFLYGYLGIAEDLDKLDFDTKKRCILKSKKQILSIVRAPIDKGGETNHT